EADERVQFVDGTVGFDAERILEDALAAREASFASIASLGVDAIQGKAWMVEGFIFHAFIVTRFAGRWPGRCGRRGARGASRRGSRESKAEAVRRRRSQNRPR